MNLFSNKNRFAWQGPFPSERLARVHEVDLSAVPQFQPMNFRNAEQPRLLGNAMAMFIAMLDTIRDGPINQLKAEIPHDPTERAHNLKGAGYFFDAGEMAICKIDNSVHLQKAVRNPDIDQLVTELGERQVKAHGSGTEQIMAQLKEAVEKPDTGIDHHSHAIICMIENPREVDAEEPGSDWIQGCGFQRSAQRAAEIATVLASYLRVLGFDARAHTATTTDVDLNRLCVSSGIARLETKGKQKILFNPFVGDQFAVAAITTTLELECDKPLASNARAQGLRWHFGYGTGRRKSTARPYAGRRFVDGELAFEKIKRVEQPTTLVDEARIPRVPKRADMFPRSAFGDFGKKVQAQTIGGKFIVKYPLGYAPRMAMAAHILLQSGEVAEKVDESTIDPVKNSQNVKAALYFLGTDAVGISRCPDWVYYSHDAMGDPIKPYHLNAITMMIDQGRDSMEGSSGDDWLSVVQSMRAYLRNSILGGIVAAQIRSLGYDARVHSAVDGEVLQAPLSLISGMGEMSRIGEVILHPLLGPRLKTGVVTTNMPLSYDRPIDFGLQDFCKRCNKCARECPSGAITAGPKTMFNGYETWKSDSQRCMNYRLTNAAGAMCGRCMKTCPWNLEGIFAEKPFRFLATRLPKLAPLLSRIDDWMGHGRINPLKKWWWDIEIDEQGRYVSAKQTNQRELQLDLDIRQEDQTLAVYPAKLIPPPWPYPAPVDREAGIRAYQELLSPTEYRRRLQAGEVENLVPPYVADRGESSVLRLIINKVETLSEGICRYVFRDIEGRELPQFEAGAHIDVLVAPEFLREYSLSGDPADRGNYQIDVLREAEGRGGSALLQRIFTAGRRVFVGKPVNNFPLIESASRSLFFGGGIGVTPFLAIAHHLHAAGAEFELHYSINNRLAGAFLDELKTVGWSENVRLHISDDGSRADLRQLLASYDTASHVYTCGPDSYMRAVIEAAQNGGWPQDSIHWEYFSVPQTAEYENFPFQLKLASSGQLIPVSAQQTATDALAEVGINVTIKCSDGLCGVCKCGLISGEVEHRDFVLSNAQRQQVIILCQSRAKRAGGTVEIDL